MKSESIKRIVRNAANSVDSVIEYYKKSNYGATHMYIKSSHKDAISMLTNAKTLTPINMEALKDLGFTFKEALQ